MPRTTVDPVALYEALDAARSAKGMSWRGVAVEMGVSPSLLSRLRQGQRPDANGFATVVSWLGVDAEQFFVAEDAGLSHRPGEVELMAKVAPLLRADKDLQDEDVQFITNVINAAVTRAKASK